MNYIRVNLARIGIGKALPVSLWDSRGNLLLRKGQSIVSEQQRHSLATHQASATAADYRAWQRSYDRLVYGMLRSGLSVAQIANAPMPDEIQEADYALDQPVLGGWLDVQTSLHGLMFQADQSAKDPAAEPIKNALERIQGIHQRAADLLAQDADESLFHLFQALGDTSLSYCATHALLCAVLCQLTAQKIDLATHLQPMLFRAALLMNIGMAKEQDAMARQSTALSDWQRQLIRDHAARSARILQSFELHDDDLIALVRDHHSGSELALLGAALPGTARPGSAAPPGALVGDEIAPGAQDAAGVSNLLPLHSLATCHIVLHTADTFVAKMAARKTRHALSAIRASKSVVIGTLGEAARIGSAMASVLGFYPPGSYVALANGEQAVSVRRGATAHAPLVVSVIDSLGVALASPVGHDTRDKAFAITAPVMAERVKLKLSADRIQKAAAKLVSTKSSSTDAAVTRPAPLMPGPLDLQ